MEKKNNKAALGIADVLLIVFIVLKLTHVIDWSWWWVLSPLWISFAIFMLIYIVIWIYTKN